MTQSFFSWILLLGIFPHSFLFVVDLAHFVKVTYSPLTLLSLTKIILMNSIHYLEIASVRLKYSKIWENVIITKPYH